VKSERKKTNTKKYRLWRGLFVLWAFICVSLSASLASVRTLDFGGEVWQEIKEKHFIVYYDPGWDGADAKKVLRAAEEYYQKIGDMVGFTRYADFWTWEQRAKIFIFSDQGSFVRRTGAPVWSLGYSDRDSYLFQSRAIVTYRQEERLFDEILPHEISHLILHDFVPAKNLPVWIDEGIAQLHEYGKYEVADKMMTALALAGQYIRFDFLNQWDIRREEDAQKVEIFYAQSLSVMRFLRDYYGSEDFKKFCRNLRDGKSVDESLRFAYPTNLRSLQDLQQAWVKYIINR
jgi:hypothetical protein